MNIKQIENIYNDMLMKFPDTLKNTSKDNNKPSINKYMTMCEIIVVNFDTFKNEF